MKHSLSFRMQKFILSPSVCRISYDFLSLEDFKDLYEELMFSFPDLDFIYTTPSITTGSFKLTHLLVLEFEAANKVEVANPPVSEWVNWCINCQNINSLNYYRELSKIHKINLSEKPREKWRDTLLENKVVFNPLLEKGILIRRGESFIADFATTTFVFNHV